MSNCKVVCLGGGSRYFRRALPDLVMCDDLSGSEIVLYDIDAEKVERMAAMGRRLSECASTEFVVRATSDLADAVDGADFAISSIAGSRRGAQHARGLLRELPGSARSGYRCVRRATPLWFPRLNEIQCMAKRIISCKVVSHGIYKNWDRESRDLPAIEKFSDTIPFRVGIEFGYILNIKNAKGKMLHYSIGHPPFRDENGDVAPPFTGELYVRTNDWGFLLGDTVWEPVGDKVGKWRLVTTIEETVLEDRTFTIVEE